MEIDRLSNLSDDIIQEVLSRLDSTKEAVRTCVLSKRWTHQWTRVHSLSFSDESFIKRGAFEEFVLHVLRHHQPSIKIRKFRFFCKEHHDQSFINGVFDHANLLELERLETDLHVSYFRPSLVGCQTLKTLYLGPRRYYLMGLSSNSFNFAWLKNLHLSSLDINTNGPDDDIFSSCMNLVNLKLASCRVYNTKVFNINAPRLVQLIIIGNRYGGEIKISAPKVKRFEYTRGTLGLGELVINEDVALDEVTLQMTTYSNFVSREELREYISSLTEWLQGRTKSFNVSLTYFENCNPLTCVKREIKSVRGPFNKEIKYIEHEKKCDRQVMDKPWI